MASADFAEARRGEMSGGTEWALPILRALERLGFAASGTGRPRIFAITAVGREEIAALPLTPRRMAAFPDERGSSVCLASARQWNAGRPLNELDRQSIVDGMGLTEPLERAENAEADRILALMTQA
ncbi:hypothetical protein [Paracoccus sp. ME4]|uniref:hypothetical protein n=1 Tax=Paracoccus sp. ME4 TaxID=3138066 RepID=UPI00398B3494